MTIPVEHYEDKGGFEADGKAWKANVQFQGEGEHRKGFATVFSPNPPAVYQLHPTLLTENGEVETFKIKRIDGRSGKADFIPPSEMPEAALDKLVSITTENKLQGDAGYYSNAGERDTGRIQFSHTIEVEGKQWHIAQLLEKDTDTPIPALSFDGAYGKELVALKPTQVSDDGKITESTLAIFRDMEWKEPRESLIPARVKEELLRFGDKFKHFGEQGKVLQERIDARANTILSETDMDAGLANLLKEHHEKSLDDALDTRDFSKAKEAAEETKSHREAAEKLGKPKGHLERLKFERDQQTKMAENGDIERFSR
ncbi:MAG: hypothetical protein FJX23_06500 [Alphaproteobacteria bacterium]|nr:hypothetical protein [Alphaproteobacteria bacterium]